MPRENTDTIDCGEEKISLKGHRGTTVDRFRHSATKNHQKTEEQRRGYSQPLNPWDIYKSSHCPNNPTPQTNCLCACLAQKTESYSLIDSESL